MRSLDLVRRFRGFERKSGGEDEDNAISTISPIRRSTHSTFFYIFDSVFCPCHHFPTHPEMQRVSCSGGLHPLSGGMVGPRLSTDLRSYVGPALNVYRRKTKIPRIEALPGKEHHPWVTLALIGMFSAPLLCLAGATLENGYGVCFISAGILIFASEITFSFVKNRKVGVPEVR